MTLRRTAAALAAALTLAATAAPADDRLARFETLSEESTALMLDALVGMAVAEGADPARLDGALPVFEWTDPYRDAGACMLTAYDAQIGADGTDALLARMETFLAAAEGKTLTEIAAMSDTLLPEGLSEDRSIEISQECGMMDLQVVWMEESGFMAAMMGAMPGN